MKAITNKPGHWILFRVRDKQNEKHPDWRGGANVNGVEYELAGWEKAGERAGPYLSGTIALPRDETTADARAAADLDRSFGGRPVNNPRGRGA
jgi:hypothetical protein